LITQGATLKTLLFLFFLTVPTFQQAQAETIKEVRFASPAWKGYTHKDGTGAFWDLLRKLYKQAGIKMKFVIAPWTRAKRLTLSGKADAIMAETKGGKEKFYFPKHHIDEDTVSAIYDSQKFKNVTGQKSLIGKKLIWIRGYEFEIDLKFKKVKFKETDNLNYGLVMLKKGKVDFLLDYEEDIIPATKEIKMDMKRFKLVVVIAKNSYPAFRQSERSKKLIKIYDDGMAIMIKSGEVDKIYKKYGLDGYPASVE